MKRKIALVEGASAGAGEDSGTSRVNPWTGKAYSSTYYDILAKRQNLPVYQFLDDLKDKVRRSQVIVVEGETGSGKTTQVRAK